MKQYFFLMKQLLGFLVCMLIFACIPSVSAQEKPPADVGVVIPAIENQSHFSEPCFVLHQFDAELEPIPAVYGNADAALLPVVPVSCKAEADYGRCIRAISTYSQLQIRNFTMAYSPINHSSGGLPL